MDEILTAEVDTSGLFYSKEIESSFSGVGLQWHPTDKDMTPEPFSLDQSDAEDVLLGDGLGGDACAVEHAVELPTTTPWTQKGLPEIIAERLRAGAVYLESIPKELVKTMGTPWCHPQVFKRDVPESLKGMPLVK